MKIKLITLVCVTFILVGCINDKHKFKNGKAPVASNLRSWVQINVKNLPNEKWVDVNSIEKSGSVVYFSSLEVSKTSMYMANFAMDCNAKNMMVYELYKIEDNKRGIERDDNMLMEKVAAEIKKGSYNDYLMKNVCSR